MMEVRPEIQSHPPLTRGDPLDRQNISAPNRSRTAEPKPDKESGEKKSLAEPGTSASVSDRVTLSAEAEEIRSLALRDREVAMHEAAHAAVGGSYAGQSSFSYTTGPDGRRYRTGGEVEIDLSKIPGDPQATLAKASVVRAAALAPPDPSAADRAIAASAARMAAEAKAELTTQGHQQTATTGSQKTGTVEPLLTDGSPRAGEVKSRNEADPPQAGGIDLLA